MKIIKYFFLCLSLLATFNIFAADEDPRPLVSIDTSWIKDKSQVKGANFTALINRLNHELIQTGIYRVVDYADTVEVLKKVDEYTVISDEDGMETSIKIPHSYIRLTVVQYGTTSESSQDYFGTSSAKQTAIVELILTLVDMNSGETKSSKNIKRIASAAISAESGTRKTGNWSEQALQEACAWVCKDIVNELLSYYNFFILDIEGADIMVDVPPQITSVGAKFTIFKAGKKIKSKRTGQARTKNKAIGTLVITRFDEDVCYARLDTIVEGEKVDDKCFVQMQTQTVQPTTTQIRSDNPKLPWRE